MPLQETGIDKSRRSGQTAVIRASDAALSSFLRAATEREANRCLDRLQREFIDPAVNGTLAKELRRSEAVNIEQLDEEREAFEELSILVSGRVALRLRRLRDSILSVPPGGGAIASSPPPPEPLVYLFPYVVSATKNAIIDYLRRKRPGRRALDTALQAAFLLSDVFTTWRVRRSPDFEELYCGRNEWQDAAGAVMAVLPLAQRPDLLARLRRELEGRDPAVALETVFHVAAGPLLYEDLLGFLADLWDVEAPYRLARGERSLLRAPRLTATPEQDPERIALRIGTLQEVWTHLEPLSPLQAASLLLHLPSLGSGSFLREFIRLGVTSEEEVADRTGLSVHNLRRVEPDLPLEDGEIASLFGVPTEVIRRIRQDARRRLNRSRERSSA